MLRFFSFLVTKSSIYFKKRKFNIIFFGVSRLWKRMNKNNQNIRFQTFFNILTSLKIFILTVNQVKCKHNQSYKDVDGLHVPGNTCYCVHNNQVAREVNEWMNEFALIYVIVCRWLVWTTNHKSDLKACFKCQLYNR